MKGEEPPADSRATLAAKPGSASMAIERSYVTWTGSGARSLSASKIHAPQLKFLHRCNGPARLAQGAEPRLPKPARLIAKPDIVLS